MAAEAIVALTRVRHMISDRIAAEVTDHVHLAGIRLLDALRRAS